MAKLLTKIKAFFRVDNVDKEITLFEAEIRQGTAYLHPLDDRTKTYCVDAKDVDIFINSSEHSGKVRFRLNDDLKNKRDGSSKDKKNSDKEKTGSKAERNQTNTTKQDSSQSPLLQKRKLTISLYSDEYELLTDFLKSNGFKRAEYILTCINATKKNSMEAEYKKWEAERKRRRAEERQLAKSME